ncbi:MULTISPECIES: UxaA family hydrolase [unclassified Burkholderia]|uniref:UxaA family hydrolase n=1 Tax=unclassified Burkholderia TaxID=2613784 RepID=UPI000756920C|nr:MULTISPECIES: UxaA family hydrolase [unclassified Burkholderia]KVN16807.1 hydrolase [Burkholderia sp. MSMB1552]KWZ51207.1 hydrolase [Burkholderia sp. MSMB1588]
MSAPATDARLLLLSPDDNCLIAATRLCAGQCVTIDGERVVLAQTIETGHKLARAPLAANDKVLRYGAPIGHVIRDVARGEHLHTHNLVSDYLPTYTHDAGHAFVAH